MKLMKCFSTANTEEKQSAEQQLQLVALRNLPLYDYPPAVPTS